MDVTPRGAVQVVVPAVANVTTVPTFKIPSPAKFTLLMLAAPEAVVPQVPVA